LCCVSVTNCNRIWRGLCLGRAPDFSAPGLLLLTLLWAGERSIHLVGSPRSRLVVVLVVCYTCSKTVRPLYLVDRSNSFMAYLWAPKLKVPLAKTLRPSKGGVSGGGVQDLALTLPAH